MKPFAPWHHENPICPSFFCGQFLLVDLRCHGDSASIKKRAPHSVASTALDVLKLVSTFLSIGYHFLGRQSLWFCALAKSEIWYALNIGIAMHGCDANQYKPGGWHIKIFWHSNFLLFAPKCFEIPFNCSRSYIYIYPLF